MNPPQVYMCSPLAMFSVSCSVMSDSLQPMDCSPPGSSVHGILQVRINFSGYEINIQKFIVFLYTSNLLPEREIKKIMSFTTKSRGIKYLG